jgi:hypothetical protein
VRWVLPVFFISVIRACLEFELFVHESTCVLGAQVESRERAGPPLPGVAGGMLGSEERRRGGARRHLPAVSRQKRGTAPRPWMRSRLHIRSRESSYYCKYVKPIMFHDRLTRSIDELTVALD